MLKNKNKYRLVTKSIMGYGSFEIQKKVKSWLFHHWEKFHVVIIHDDAELSYRKAKKILKELNEIDE